jgi:LytS/YehU family sensor histidine kinase
LILQPLVENAVGHGIAGRTSGGTVTVAARVGDGRLTLEVFDDGDGFRGDGRDLLREGHGLDNVRRRLATLYGDAAMLELTRNPTGQGTLARLVLPVPREPETRR